jgi:hypothetical protein
MRVRTANYFDVSLEHMTEAYKVLNGKKIDQFYVNDLIDRFGWSNGEVKNRSILSKQYNVSVNAIDIATEKLKEIVQRIDISVAYMEYVRQFEHERAVDVIRDQTGI